jgi:thioredoxin reductase (NADPH)
MTTQTLCEASSCDLRSHYGAQYRVVASDSPEGALDLLNQLKLRSDSVALLLADQRMPRMDGVQFLQKARAIFPEAKRALLTAYADTSAAISAINEAGVNYFFLKPLDPPEEHLYPNWMTCWRLAGLVSPAI